MNRPYGIGRFVNRPYGIDDGIEFQVGVVEELEDAFRGRQPRLDHRVLGREVADRDEEALDVLEERHHRADVTSARRRVLHDANANARVPDYERHAHRRDRLHHRVQDRVVLDRLIVGVAVGAVDHVVVRGAARFTPEGLHRLDPLHLLGQVRVQVRDVTLDGGEGLSRVATDHLYRDAQGRQRHERHQRQAPVQVQHRRQDPDQQQHVGDGGHGTGRKHLADGVHVVGDAGEYAADGGAVVVADASLLRVQEHGAAQVGHGALSGELHRVDLPKPRDELEHHHAGESRHDVPQDGRASLHDGGVNGELEQVRLAKLRDGGQRDQHQRGDKQERVPTHVRQQPAQQLKIHLRLGGLLLVELPQQAFGARVGWRRHSPASSCSSFCFSARLA